MSELVACQITKPFGLCVGGLDVVAQRVSVRAHEGGREERHEDLEHVFKLMTSFR